MLGVLFTIPLRRALVTTSDLPYPEGVAAAEVLKVGSRARAARRRTTTGESREGLTAVILGSVASAGLAITRGHAHRRRRTRRRSFVSAATASTGYNIAWSLALFGAGHLVGLSVGMAMHRRSGDRVGDRGADPDVDDSPPAAGVDLAAHTIGDLAHAGAVHRRGRDRGRRDLYAAFGWRSRWSAGW